MKTIIFGILFVIGLVLILTATLLYVPGVGLIEAIEEKEERND